MATYHTQLSIRKSVVDCFSAPDEIFKIETENLNFINMIVKVPIYVNLDSKNIDSNLIPEVVMVISDAVTEHLQAKLPKSKRKIKISYDDSEEVESKSYDIVTRKEAINSFR